jgi:hypothetical protein
MSFRPEGSSYENDVYTNETLIEETPSIENEGYNSSNENFSLEGYFDDGFGDMDNEPKNVILESEEDIKKIENTYNVDITSIIDKEKFAV